jgi:hypothetical protein
MMTRLMMLAVLVMAIGLAGCGNVDLRGEGLASAQQSAMDAYQATQRADADPATPAWQKAYLTENFKQWRFFVRSARKDGNWGPKLADETATTQGVR